MRRALICLLAACISTAVTAVTAFAAIPASAKWESSAASGIWNNGGFFVLNDAWNTSPGPQTIWAGSYHYWGVESDQSAGNSMVETYPDVQKNYNDVPLKSLHLIQNGFTESMPSGRGVDAEAADDVWLNDDKIEVMIWVDNHGQTPAGTVINYAEIFGQRFAVWHTGTIYTFALDHNETSGVTHILASIQWLVEHGYVPAGATLRQVDFGWEIVSTGGKPMDFAVTNYWLRTQP